MSTVVSKDGTTIAYDRRGSGDPVILVDGATCSRAFGPMPEVAGKLSDRFTVFAYDRRGRNESGDTQPYAVQREIEDIQALIAEAGGSAALVGYSSGAVLAARAAAHDIGVTKLVMWEPPVLVDDSREPVPADYHDQLRKAVAEGRNGDAFVLFVTLAVGMPEAMVEPMKGSPIWSQMEAVASTLLYDALCIGDEVQGEELRDELVEKLAAVTAETLVLDGGASPAWMRRSAREVADAIKGARYDTIDGVDHNVPADAIVPVLREFLRA